MGNVVSFINMKGGVGKTTLSVNVGYTLAKNFKKKILLIDADPQMNATQYTLKNEQVKTITDNPLQHSIYGILTNNEQYLLPSISTKDTKDSKNIIVKPFKIIDNFEIIPSHLGIMNIDLDKSPFKLRQYIRENKLKDNYDLIIIDLPPTISSYTKISLLASDSYIVPMKPDFLSYFGLPLLESYISKLSKEFDHKLSFWGLIFCMVRTNLKIYKEIKKHISDNPEWKSKLFKTELKFKASVAMSLSPETMRKILPYIIEGSEKDIIKEIIEISKELLQKGRI